MPEILLIVVVLISIAVFFSVYLFESYVLYRIVVKFEPATSFAVMLIPVWSVYLLYRTSIIRPGLYLLATFIAPLPGFLLAGEDGAKAIGYVMWAHAMGRISEKLGGKYITSFLISLIPVINLVFFVILAFGSSRPLAANPDNTGSLIAASPEMTVTPTKTE